MLYFMELYHIILNINLYYIKLNYTLYIILCILYIIHCIKLLY